MKKFLTVPVLLGMSTVAEAAVQNYEGTGVFTITQGETQDVAKKRAKLEAERAALDKAGVSVTSFSQLNDAKLTAQVDTDGIANFLKLNEKDRVKIVTDSNRLKQAADTNDKHVEVKHCDRALADFNKALELAPDTVDAYKGRALCYKRLGDEEKMQTDIAKVNELTGKS